MSDSSEDERRASPKKPSRQRKRLRPMPLTSTKEDEPVSCGILTNVSADYRQKMREAEIKTFIQKSKLDIDNPPVPVKGRLV